MSTLAKDSLVAALVIQLLYENAPRREFNRVLTAHYPEALTRLAVVGGLQVCANGLWAEWVDGTHRAYLAGVRGREMAEKVAVGYLLQPLNINSRDVNEMFLLDAARMVEFVTFPLQGPDLLEVYGHSAGGATAEILAEGLRLSGKFTVARVMTMGAPKPGTPNFICETPGTQRRRLMAAGDPVPLLPFSAISTSHSIALTALVSAQLARGREPMHIWDFRHGTGGAIAGPGGFLREQIDALTFADPVIALSNWMRARPTEVRYHSINHYIDVITGIVRQEAPDVFPKEKGFSREPAESGPNLVLPFEIADHNRNAGAVRLVMPFEIGGSGIPSPAVVSVRDGQMSLPDGTTRSVATTRGAPMGQVKVPPILQAKAYKVSGGWSVYWMEYAVFFSRYSSSARGVAKAINRLSRVYGTRGAVSANAMVTATTAFLTAAATSPNGTRPPLDVD